MFVYPLRIILGNLEKKNPYLIFYRIILYFVQNSTIKNKCIILYT